MDKFFRNLCQVADVVTITDGYIVSDAKRGGVDSGFLKFVSLCEQSSVKTIKIITGVGARQFVNKNGKQVQATLKATDLEADLRSILATVNHPHIDFQCFGGATRAHALHDRLIEFRWSATGSVVAALGKGLSQFDGILASSTHTVARQRDNHVERLLSSIAAQPVVKCTI